MSASGPGYSQNSGYLPSGAVSQGPNLWALHHALASTIQQDPGNDKNQCNVLLHQFGECIAAANNCASNTIHPQLQQLHNLLTRSYDYFEKRRSDYIWTDSLVWRNEFGQFMRQTAFQIDQLLDYFIGISKGPPPRNTGAWLEEARQEDDKQLVGFTSQLENKSNPGAVSRAIERRDVAALNSLAQNALQAHDSTISRDAELRTEMAKNAERTATFILSYTKQAFLPEAILKRRLVGEWQFLIQTNKYDIYKTEFDTEESVVVKVLRDQRHGEDAQAIVSRFQRQVNIWQPLHYDHILHFYGVGTRREGDRTQIYSVSPFIQNSDAVSYLRKHSCPIEDRLTIVLDVAMGLRYLLERSPPVVHFNVQSDNVLINKQGRGVLSGFGFSQEISGQSAAHHTGQSTGMSRFRAPEYYNEPNSSPKTSADVYGWAMTALHLVGGKLPFCEESEDFSAVTKATQTHRPNSDLYPDIQKLANATLFLQLLSDCWHHNEAKRPTMDVVVVRMKSIRDTQLGRRDPPVASSTQPRRQADGSSIEPSDGQKSQGAVQGRGPSRP